MKFPTLYKKTKIGRIQIWEIECIGDSFLTREGIVDGKITESKPTKCFEKNTGKKNATSSYEQCIKEAKAKFDKKLKTGGYWENVDDAKSGKVKFNEPMLAQKFFKSKHKVTYPCMVDRKYNGGRINAYENGLFTRKNEKYKSIPHIENSLKHLFINNPNMMLDGEGYNHDFRYKLNEMMSILNTDSLKKLTDAFFQKSEELVRFYVYDGFNFTVDGIEVTEETPCLLRREALKKFLKDVKYVVVVEHEIAQSENDVMKIYESHISDGYEGSMIRNSQSFYQFGRTFDLLKMKPEDDAEARIVKINEGEGNWTGMAATAILRRDDGAEFKATFKGDADDLIVIFNNQKDWIGKEVTYLFNGFTGKGIPNYARIDIYNCFKK